MHKYRFYYWQYTFHYYFLLLLLSPLLQTVPSPTACVLVAELDQFWCSHRNCDRKQGPGVAHDLLACVGTCYLISVMVLYINIILGTTSRAFHAKRDISLFQDYSFMHSCANILVRRTTIFTISCFERTNIIQNYLHYSTSLCYMP